MEAQRRIKPLTMFIVCAALLLSGMSALVYEVVWLGLLKLIFGDTVFAVSTVLAAFMAGLAIGTYFVGARIDSRPRAALKWYALMEIGVGLYALLVPSLLDSLAPIGVWVTEEFRSDFYILTLLRFTLSFVVLLPATTLMGGTLPVLVKQFATQDPTVGRSAGRLYAFNTIGAAAGSLATAFFLIENIGIHGTITFGATLNMVSGVAVLVLAFFSGELPLTAPKEEAHLAKIDSYITPKPLMRALPWIYGLSGFVALALEIIWIRMLAMYTSMHVQSFGAMLAIVLSGIAIGSAVATKLLAKGIEAVRWLVALEIAIGVWTLISVPIFRTIPPLPLPPHGPIPDIDAPAPPVILSVIPPSLVLILIPALLMGMIFPLIVHCYAGQYGNVGKNFGKIYGFNLVGGIAGSLAGAFILLPLLGVQQSMLALSAISIALGCAVLILSQGFRLRPVFGPVVAVIGILALAAAFPEGLSEKRPPVRGLDGPWQLVHYREGRTAAIRVFENADTGARELFFDSLYIASTEHEAMRVQKMLANLPLLLHRRPEQVLIIGFGTGTTSGVSMLYDVHVDAVELEPTELQSAKLFQHVNYGVFDPRWTSKFALHIGDGRNWLLTRQRTYDIISRDAHLPKPSQDLFSREFLALAKSRLKPGGIFCGFLPLESSSTAKRMLPAFHDVFPHGSVWYVSPVALLVLGTEGPLEIDYQSLKARMSEPAKQRDLADVNFQNPGDLLASFAMASDGLARFVAGFDAATDERPLGFLSSPDFGSPRDVETLTDDLLAHRMSINAYVRNIGTSKAAEKKIRAELDARTKALSKLIRGQLALMIFRDSGTARRNFSEILRAHPDWQEVRFQYALALSTAAEDLLAKADAADAVPLILEANRYAERHASNYVLLGRAYERLGDAERSRSAFQKASEIRNEKGYPPIPLVKEKLAGAEKMRLAK